MKSGLTTSTPLTLDLCVNKKCIAAILIGLLSPQPAPCAKSKDLDGAGKIGLVWGEIYKYRAMVAYGCKSGVATCRFY